MILIRSVLSFILLLLLTRIMGKKQISQLTFFDYCVSITIGSIAADMSVDQNVKIINGLTSLAIWGIFPILLSFVGLKSRKFQQITDGKPAIIIKHGMVLEESMKKNHLTIDELMLLLREKDVFKLSDVEMAILETNGELSVLKKTSQQPVTPQMIRMVLKEEEAPTLLILDGQILHKNLSVLGYTEDWLIQELKKLGASNIQEVFLAQVDSNGKFYIDFYDEGKNSK